jgi:hypothetical protein
VTEPPGRLCGGDAMATRILKPAVILAALIALAPQATAGGHRHGGSSFSFGFGGFFPAAPYYPYYPPYAYYPPYYYAPPIAYLPPPAAVPTPQPNLGSGVGQGCREYTVPVSVDGRVVDTYGTACPTGDGSWRIIN